MAVGNFLFGTPERTQQFQLKTPQQQGLQNQAIGGAGNILQQLLGGGGFNFAPIEQLARTNFETKTIPGLAERLTSFGGQGGQRSSAYPAQLSSAASQLEQGLAAQKAQYGLQQQGLNQNLLGMLLGQSSQPSFENLFRPREAGFFENTSNKVAEYLPTILGALFGVPLPPMSGGGQQQGGGLYQLSGGLGGGYNPNMGFGGQNFSQLFGQGRF